jgi:hypothetical protein
LNDTAYLNEDAVLACADLVGRGGASGFESPSLAAIALAERLLRGAACRCGDTVVLSGGDDGCRWRLIGARWEPGCDVKPVQVKGERGDLTAITRAMANRAERRAAKRKRG